MRDNVKSELNARLAPIPTPRHTQHPTHLTPNTDSLPKFKLAPVLFQLSLDQTFGASVLNSGFLVSLWAVQALVAGTLFPLGCVHAPRGKEGTHLY